MTKIHAGTLQVLAACLITVSSLVGAELTVIETTGWTDPGNMGWQFSIRYTVDSVTHEKQGIYEERWISGGDALKLRVNYVNGLKDGEEVAYPWLLPSLDNTVTQWDMGVKLSSIETIYWPNGNLGHTYVQRWNASGYIEETTYYHETGQLAGHAYGEHALPSMLMTYGSYISYNEAGQLITEGWRKSRFNEHGQNTLYNVGPYAIQNWDDGTQRFYTEYNNIGQRHGVDKSWDENGNLIEVTEYKNGKRDGIADYYYEGALYSTSHYTQDIRTAYFGWYPEGGLKIEQHFSNGSQCGIETQYTTDGRIYSTRDYGPCAAILIEGEEEFDETGDPESVRVLSGIVYDKILGLPLKGVTIAAGAYITTTDVAGAFKLSLGIETQYQLELSLDGYTTRRGRLDMSDFQTRTIRVHLLPEGADDKPVISDIKSSNGDIFYAGMGTTNTYTAELNWGEATQKDVAFNINGSSNSATLGTDTATATFNMDSVLKAGVRASTNKIEVIASNAAGVQSVPFVLKPVLVPQPDWLTALGTFSPAETSAGLMSFKLSRQWPGTPVTLALTEENLGSYAWQAWGLMPFIGGQEFGISAVQALMDVEMKTDGNGSLLLGGQAGVVAGGSSITGKLGGKGYYAYKPNKGIEWNKGSMLIGIEGTINKEAGLVTVIPALANAVNLPVVGRGISWLNGTAKVHGTIGMGADMEFVILNDNSGLNFGSSEGTLSTKLALGLNGGPESMKVSFEGVGEIKSVFQLPAEPSLVKTVDATLSANLNMTTWLFQKTFTASHSYSYPMTAANTSFMRLKNEDPDFHPIGRGFINTSYHTIPSPAYRKLSLQADYTHPWTKLIENVFPFIDMAWNANGTTTVYTYFDPAKQTLQATELRIYNGWGDSEWTSDTYADFQPSIGNTVAWMRVREPDFDSDLEQMASLMEIAWSTVGSTPEFVTDNSHMDFNPVLVNSATHSQDVLFWQSNVGNLLVGTNDYPSEVFYTDTLTPAGFANAATVPYGFIDAQHICYAVNRDQYAIAWIQDMDGDITTQTDQEIYYLEANDNTWGTPVRVTQNTVGEQFPRLVSDNSGQIHLFWEESGSVQHMASGVVEQAVAATGDPFVDILAMRKPGGMDLLAITRDTEGNRAAVLLYHNEGTWSALELYMDIADVDIRQFSQDTSGRYIFLGLQEEEENYNMVSMVLNLPHHSKDLQIEFPQGHVFNPPVPGQTYEIPLVLTNRGTADMERPCIALMSDFLSSTNVLSRLVMEETLKSGESAMATLEWTAPDTAIPSKLLISRVAESNNISMGDYVLEADIPTCDLKVTRLEYLQEPNESATIRVSFTNVGRYAATGIPVNIVVDDQVLGSASLNGLYPGKSAEVLITVWPNMDFPSRFPLLEAVVGENERIKDADWSNNRIAYQVPQIGLWVDAESIGSYTHLDWFGYLAEQPTARVTQGNFIYHTEHGWQYAIGDSPESMYLYDFGIGAWLWSNETTYPFLYQYDVGWLFYYRGGNPKERLFFNCQNAQYFNTAE